MALKKPSEYFNNQESIADNLIQEAVAPTELNTFSDAFKLFKKNLNQIETLSSFSETLDNYALNVEKIDYLSKKIDDIQEEIANVIKKEDVDNIMLSHLLSVEQIIHEVQKKVKGINQDNLDEIKSTVLSLTGVVDNFISREAPRYKKMVMELELRSSKKYDDFEKNVNEALHTMEVLVDGKFQEFVDNIREINEDNLSPIIEDFETLTQTIQDFKENDIPKYKDVIVRTELKVEDKINEFEKKFNTTLSSIQSKISSVEKNKDDLAYKVNEKIDEIVNLKNSVILYIKEQQNATKDYKARLNEKLADLEAEVIRNESHIKSQNKNLEKIQENVLSTIQKLNVEELEKNNYELGKKVKYLEEVFEKFNEKEILTESIIVEPPPVDNKDPLTPLDKNFVTLEQLQQHYRLFINRIQQQLATLGGGGETRLKYLDDIVGIATNAGAYDGKYLKYSHSLGKFEFSEVSGGIGGIGIGITTNSLLGVGITSLVFTGQGISDIIVDENIATINIVGQSSQNYDGGVAESLYGGTEPIICGGA